MSTLMWDGAIAPGARAPRGRPTPARDASPRAASAPRAAAAPTLRLTARGRAVLAVLALLAAVWVLGPAGAFAGDRPDVRPVSAVTVGAGDTLWGIAQSVARPDQDVRDVVDAIAALNELDGSRIVVGEQLLVPAPASD
jgi:hypothetical protein